MTKSELVGDLGLFSPTPYKTISMEFLTKFKKKTQVLVLIAFLCECVD